MRNRILTSHNVKPQTIGQDMLNLEARIRRIYHLKYALPCLALAVILLLILWPRFRQWHYDRLPKLEHASAGSYKDNTATYLSYQGVDRHNQPFTLSAEQGLEISSYEIELFVPHMKIVLNSGATVTLSASSGTYNKKTGSLHLVGNVILTHSRGYSLETGQAWLNCTHGSAYTSDYVWGSGPAGSIRAKGFALMEEGDKICFKKQAELYLHSR